MKHEEQRDGSMKSAKASPGLIAVIGIMALVELAGLVAVIARALTL
jgi:hypothetical protein